MTLSFDSFPKPKRTGDSAPYALRGGVPQAAPKAEVLSAGGKVAAAMEWYFVNSGSSRKVDPVFGGAPLASLAALALSVSSRTCVTTLTWGQVDSEQYFGTKVDLGQASRRAPKCISRCVCSIS